MHEAMEEVAWSVMPFSGLDGRLLHDIIRLRVDVFVVEQDCPYPELDGLDLDAWHVMGRKADGSVVAYARILPPDEDGMPHIGRVVVAPGHRGRGLGHRLMEETLEALGRLHGSRRSALAAQAHLQDFYRRSGYVSKGPEYMLDGIPHVDMVRAGM